MIFDLLLSYDTILRVCWFVWLLISIYGYLQVGPRGMYQTRYCVVFDSILSYLQVGPRGMYQKKYCMVFDSILSYLQRHSSSF
jgi:hypothetical protein